MRLDISNTLTYKEKKALTIRDNTKTKFFIFNKKRHDLKVGRRINCDFVVLSNHVTFILFFNFDL